MARTGKFPNSTGQSILVVEDDDAIGELLEILLQMAGYTVRLARSVADARTALDRLIPDALVIDIKLPDGSGLDVLKAVRGRPAMMLTTTVDPAVIAAAMAAGARDYVTKPFDDRKVIERVQRLTACRAA